MMELLISWCVTSSILLAVFLLLRGTVFRTLSPRVRYALWGVVLLRLLVPFQIPSLSLPASAADLAPELPVLSNRPLSPNTATGHAVIPSDLLEENGLTIADGGTVQASPSGQDAALWELQENGEVYLYFGGPTLDDVLHAAVVLAWGVGAGVVLLVCEGLSLITGLFRNNRSIHKILKPIQDLAATTSRLNSMTHMSRQELEALAGELEKINATHLDSRIDLPATQKELRSLAQAINAMLDRINKAYSAQMRFVSDASHELRTPIAVIQGYAALLDRWGKDDPEALQESISAIRSEAKSMEELVEQLLFLARGDNDTQPVKPSLFDLSALAGEVLREEEMICPDRVFLPRWGEEPVPVRADQGLIKQVMRILMDNAIKYSSPGSRIYLRLSTQERYARLTVQDEGDGIPPESIPHIFERFYRTDQSRDRKTGGTGLGLSIARWIVERHEGWFEVVSRPGVGTRISFLLPLALPEQEAG